ncbi:tetratricopeptide repeat protein [Zestomonas carbonaria]|uniref:Secretory immunoglobulin A-binding protein EsiB n=1 Tax=Zestomonas carbonaria TaxID=2762745 RepID=A0A7U7EN34_9GAMM|nr:tetratricopeptide repeat protein [Pseudomonas carbonaria]CAD5107970.1 Secretory immunoglobulin A-binding protein EsiB [Pseudomonas carbonaria]
MTTLSDTDPRTIARLLLEAAGQGEVDAQALLGQILLDGQGISRDAALAFTWFGIAARQGHAMALNMLGRCHEHGWGCPPDLEAAARCFQQAAERGLDWGMYNLANLLATGRGVAQDHRQAFALYLRAAELGHAKSMNLVGRYLHEGVLAEPEPQAALEWFRRSAEGGDFRGQFSYALRLLEQDRAEQARHWLERALAGGNLNFLRASRDRLLALPGLDDLALAYHRRAAELGDGSDHESYQALLARQPGSLS